MSETEVQPLVALIGRIRQVVQLLVVGESVPLLVALLVAEDIVSLGEEVQDDINACNGQENAISSLVVGCVVYETVSL